MLKASLRLFPVCRWVIIKMSFASWLFGTQKGLFSHRNRLLIGDEAPRHECLKMQWEYSLFEVNS